MDPESGDPNDNYGDRLSQQGYTSASFASAYEKDTESLEYRCRSAYADRAPLNKMRPDCLRLVSIIQTCKFKIPPNAAHNVIRREDKNAPPIREMRSDVEGGLIAP